MSTSGLSGASLIGATVPAGSALAVASGPPQTTAEKAKAKAETASAAQAALLADIRKTGIYAWAQEQKMAALKAKIRQQVLSDRKLDDSALKGMTPADRASAESSIEEEIARRIKEAMKASFEGQAKAAAALGKPAKPMIIDISV